MANNKPDETGSKAGGTKPLKSQDTPIKLLLYGDAGSGKTRLAGTAAEVADMREVLFMNFEGGDLTIRGREIRTTENKLDTIEAFENELWALSNKRKGYEDIRTVVIDSATEIATMILEEVIERACGRDPKRDRDTPYQGDYNTQLLIMRRLMRHARDLPMNVIVTAHARRLYARDDAKAQAMGSPISVKPEFPPRMEQSLAGYFDFIWYLDTAKVEVEGKTKLVRRLKVTPDDVYRIKTRGERFADKIGGTILDPTMEKIYKILQLTEGK